jgi:hypothetical protein
MPPPDPGEPRAPARPRSQIDALDDAEIIAPRTSLHVDRLRALHAHETAHRRRRAVIGTIERLQRWEAQP